VNAVLANEHALLRAEIGDRRRQVLDAVAAGRWPEAEARALVDFLRYEVLDQAVHEERALFPLVPRGFDDPRIHRLVAEHVGLREATDSLDDAARTRDREGGRLAAALDELSRRLDVHLRDEEEVLSPLGGSRAGARPPLTGSRTIFSLTEGSTLDLALLPADRAEDVALDRLLRMRPGDRVHVRSDASLERLWRLLRQHAAGEYGWTYLREGPLQWEAELVRRSPC
jgi:uncharacterized protein (DUF2249 family)/hemerythrin-like domain-containing protein